MDLVINIILGILSLLVPTVTTLYLSSFFRDAAAKKPNSLGYKIIDKIDYLLLLKEVTISKQENTINVLNDKNKRLTIKKEGEEIVNVYPSYWITLNINPTGSKSSAKIYLYIIFGLGMLSINLFGSLLSNLFGGDSFIITAPVFALISFAYLMFFVMNDDSIYWDISGILSDNSKVMINLSEEQLLIQGWWNKRFIKIESIGSVSFETIPSKFETKLMCVTKGKKYTLFKYPSILNKSLLTKEQVEDIAQELNKVITKL